MDESKLPNNALDINISEITEYTKIEVPSKARDGDRKIGIDIIGNAPWGTHFCQFYQAKEDLIDILAPYFKTGLENNEFCMWVTSEPLNVEDAKASLKKIVKDLDDYIKKGQVEILDYKDWYAKSGKFDSDKVLADWVEKEKEALKKGFEGLRLTGNTFWLEKKDWRNFADYEAVVNNIIGKHRMLAICSYSLDKFGAGEIIDVVSNHQFVLVKQAGKWRLVESSEHKKADETIRESEEKFKAIFENAIDGMLLADVENKKFLMGNKVICQMLGYSLKELKNIGVEDIHPKKELPFIIEQFERQMKKEFSLTTNTPVKRRDGSIFYVDINASPITLGEKSYMLGIFRDITERKKAEEALRQSEQRFKDLTETTPDWIWEVDKKGVYTYASPKIKELLGYEVSEILGKTPFDFMPKEEAERVDKIFKEKLIKKEPFYRLENINLHKKGHLVVLETSGFPICNKKGQLEGYRGIDRDITGRKKTEEELREVCAELKKIQDVLLKREKIATTGVLAAGVAHEIRNPLAIIGMTVQYLQSKLGENDPKRELTEAIIKKVDKLDRVTKELSSYGRIMNLNIRKHNLARCLNLNLALIKPKCRVQRIKIRKRYSQLPLIEMDNEQMDKAFFNIMDNAVQAMSKGGILTIATGFNEKTQLAIVKIHNTGPIIKKKHLSRIFDPFYTVKKKEGGTGLGLAIVQSVVLRHNGQVTIENKSRGKDKGVAFLIHLPVSQQQITHTQSKRAFLDDRILFAPAKYNNT